MFHQSAKSWLGRIGESEVAEMGTGENFPSASQFLTPETVKVMLHGTIRNDDFQRNTASQYWNNVITIRNNVATLCCTENRRCKSSRVTSP